MNKKDLALDSLQWLMCHETKQNKTKFIILLAKFPKVLTYTLYGRPNDCKFFQLPRMLLSIHAGLSNSEVWTVSLPPVISIFPSFFSIFVEIVPRGSI